jgi:hypothetical protein
MPATETPTPQPTETSVPTAPNPVALNSALCYGGPGRVYGVISSIKAGASLELLGKSALLDWWIIQNPIYNVPCWIPAGDVRVDLAFDTSAIEVATPPPYPATLVGGRTALDAAPPTCAVQFTVYANVTNNGHQATISEGSVVAVNVRKSDGSQLVSGTGTFPALEASETYQVSIPLTVSAYYEEEHEIRLYIDPDREIPEFNESDNTTSISYTLEQGSCP